MSALQGKGVLAVEFCYVADDPGFGIMASGTLVTYGLLVYVQVAGSTIGFSADKFKRGVTLLAINFVMTTFKPKAG